ncbi:hypothetical protein BD310DRAFT_1027832 [Dichomitus squalens]|uniref:Protein kinase domain-containing protein n=1 Tax=Dichomitus squalens TaxID=114155 RepID=A0A4V2K7D4_9APHY|nr:hypothetical protein BD310DRAFT_1027832 [Dichomitus squalens]
MPRLDAVNMVLNPKLSSILDVIDQILEGVAYLHDQRIAHMDLWDGNVLAATEQEARRVEAGRVYIIDFDRSRRLPLKPGVQGPVSLPDTVCRHPPGITQLDPYSWDVYCIGDMLRSYLRVGLLTEEFSLTTSSKTMYRENPIASIARLYVNWLIGNERGCKAACRCRPTAHRARQVLTIVRWANLVSEFCRNVRHYWILPAGKQPVSPARSL